MLGPSRWKSSSKHQRWISSIASGASVGCLNFRDGPPLLLGVIRPRPFVTNPETVNAHLQNFLHCILADRLAAGEGEDRKLLPAFDHTLAKLHRALFVEQKVFVENQEHEARILIEITFRHGVNVPAGRQQFDVFAGEEVRSAAKVATVRATQP